MEAVILAGGLGTRLSSRLSDLPKAMAPVAGRPFLEFLLDQLVDSGCARAILSVGHLRHVIMDAFERSYRRMAIDYAVEENPLGTGGAIRLALGQVHHADALVLNGDTYLQADFPALLDAHRHAGRAITMAAAWVEDRARYGGLIVEDGHVSGFAEKGIAGPGWINAGVYAMNRDFPWPRDVGERFSVETDLLVPHLSRLNPLAFLCSGYFVDIGIPQDLDRAQAELPGRVLPSQGSSPVDGE
ncbi:MAG TPA: nucleotidyltransferase family protein [Terracidiphilus sp.]|nr:nucleotidyltransferase family protein [Terracidiphilus sp.]